MGVLLQNDQPVGGISADVIETINFSDLTTTSKTLPGAINELAANPSTTESMSQAEYNALTEAEKMDGTARFVYDAISTDESELWTRVGRNTLHTDAQIISNAINEIKDTMGSGTLTTTSPTIIGGINELNSSLTNYTTYVFDPVLIGYRQGYPLYRVRIDIDNLQCNVSTEVTLKANALPSEALNPTISDKSFIIMMSSGTVFSPNCMHFMTYVAGRNIMFRQSFSSSQTWSFRLFFEYGLQN